MVRPPILSGTPGLNACESQPNPILMFMVFLSASAYGIFGIFVPSQDRARSTLPAGRVDFVTMASDYSISENAYRDRPAAQI